MHQNSNLEAARICHIGFSDQVKLCKVENKNSFFVEKDEYVPIPLIKIEPLKSLIWKTCKAAQSIWNPDDIPFGEEERIIKMFSQEGYYSKVIRDVVDCMNEYSTINIFSNNLSVKPKQGDIKEYIFPPNLHHKILSVKIDKCFIEVCKWSHSDKLTFTRAYPISEIYIKGFKKVEIIASLECRVKYEIFNLTEQSNHDCWNVYKFLLIWGTYTDINQVWRGLPFLKKESIAGVLGDLSSKGIVSKHLEKNKWLVDKEKLIDKIKSRINNDDRNSINYAKSFLNINSSVCQETAKHKAALVKNMNHE